MAANYSFLEALKAIAQYENISLAEAEQRFLSMQIQPATAAAIPPIPAPVTAPASLNWSSILRSILASAGKYKVVD
jgi:hypothetical protein